MDGRLILTLGVRVFRPDVVRQPMRSKDKREKRWPHLVPQESERMAGADWDRTHPSKSDLWWLTPSSCFLWTAHQGLIHWWCLGPHDQLPLSVSTSVHCAPLNQSWNTRVAGGHSISKSWKIETFINEIKYFSYYSLIAFPSTFLCSFCLTETWWGNRK